MPAGRSATGSRFSLDVAQRRSAAALERPIINSTNPPERYGRPTELTASTSSCTHVSTHALKGTRVAKRCRPHTGTSRRRCRCWHSAGTTPPRALDSSLRQTPATHTEHPHCGTRSTHSLTVGSGTVRRHCETVRTGRRLPAGHYSWVCLIRCTRFGCTQGYPHYTAPVLPPM